MARIVSPVWSEIRGSICGITYLTTSSGAIIARQRVKPVNRRSTYQTQVRGGLAAASYLWRNTSENNRSAWDTYALTAGYRYGKQAFFAGYVLANYLNNRFGCSIPLVITPPPEPSRYDLHDVAAVPTLSAGTGIDVKGTTLEIKDVAVFIEVSPGFSPSRRHWTGPWVQDKNTFTAIDGPGSFNKSVHGLIAGLRYFVRVIGIEADATLRTSAAWYVDAIAATTA